MTEGPAPNVVSLVSRRDPDIKADTEGCAETLKLAAAKAEIMDEIEGD